MADLTDDDVKRLRELLEMATPGPCKVADDAPECERDLVPHVVSVSRAVTLAECEDIVDAETFAALRNAAPALLDAWEERERLKENACFIHQEAVEEATQDIAQLRAKLAEVERECDLWRALSKELDAKIKSVGSELDAALAKLAEAEKEQREADQNTFAVMADRDAAVAEVTKMKEALERIDAAAREIKAAHSGWYDTGKGAEDAMRRIESSAFAIHTLARSALGKDGE